MIKKVVISAVGITSIETVNMLDVSDINVFNPEIIKLLLQLLIAIATIIKLYMNGNKKKKKTK